MIMMSIRQPDWINSGLMSHGKWLSKKYFASLFMGHFAGLLLLFNMPTLLYPVFATASHTTIANLFTRYLATFVHLKKWYSTDPFDPKSPGYKSLKKVNLFHKKILQELNHGNDWSDRTKRHFMTQYDMVITQWSIVGPIILYPKEFGLHDWSQKDFQSFIHFWRVIGYCLGIEERFNLCHYDHSYESTVYLCQLMYDQEYHPICSRQFPQKFPTFGFDMSLGLVKAMKSLAPLLSLDGLLRYTYRHVLKIENVNIDVKSRSGYRNLIYMIRVLMKYSFFHYVISWILSACLVLVSFREKAITMYLEKMYSKINYVEDIKSCPVAAKWMEKSNGD